MESKQELVKRVIVPGNDITSTIELMAEVLYEYHCRIEHLEETLIFHGIEA